MLLADSLTKIEIQYPNFKGAKAWSVPFFLKMLLVINFLVSVLLDQA